MGKNIIQYFSSRKWAKNFLFPCILLTIPIMLQIIGTNYL